MIERPAAGPSLTVKRGLFFSFPNTRSAPKVRANHIDEAKGGRLKLIIRGGVGVDNIDVKHAEEAWPCGPAPVQCGQSR